MRVYHVVYEFMEIEYDGTPAEKARLTAVPPQGYRYLSCGSRMEVAHTPTHQLWRDIVFTLTFVKETEAQS